MGLFDKFMKKQTVAPTISQDSVVLFDKEFLISGIEYPCRKNSKKKRQAVNSKMKIGDVVLLERFVYQGKPAYMVVDPKTNLDIGVLFQNASNWVDDYFSKGNCYCELTDMHKGSFKVTIKIFQ